MVSARAQAASIVAAAEAKDVLAEPSDVEALLSEEVPELSVKLLLEPGILAASSGHSMPPQQSSLLAPFVVVNVELHQTPRALRASSVCGHYENRLQNRIESRPQNRPKPSTLTAPRVSYQLLPAIESGYQAQILSKKEHFVVFKKNALYFRELWVK
ncbi:hypothetical protein B0H13DRAFT_1891541 [Mycena leptocephala]|nr:hypothetical protein B0H13DRAFT_1891541 [Mycena leptocephala]